MKFLWFLVLIGILCCTANIASAQSCNPGGPAGTFNFFTTCQAGTSYVLTGNYALTVGNNKTMVINGNVTINGTLTITLTGSFSRVIVQSPYTLTATNITFAGSATGKQLEVQGPSGSIAVSGTMDLNDLTIEIDGSGSISAGAIIGAQNTTCVGVADCPTITAGSCIDGAGSFCEDSLPVELLGFSAGESSNEVSLNWSTASQLNFSHFEVQHSVNAEEWLMLATIEGEGTTNELKEYSFEHTFPQQGKNYYRLKMVDLDETFEFSPVEAVTLAIEKSFNLSPNPVKNLSVNYHLNFEPAVGDMLSIYDLTGSELQSIKITSNSEEIILDPLIKAGSYLAQYKGKEVLKVVRLIVQ
jgi:hypothetical protein